MTPDDDNDSNSGNNYLSYYPRTIWSNIKKTAIIICEFVIASVTNPDNFPVHLSWFFTLLLAIFAYGAWQETRTDFQLDQRPVLDLSDTPVLGYVNGPDYGRIAPDHIAWNYMIKNYGKGAAFDVRICPFLRVGGSRFIASNKGQSGEGVDIVSSKVIWQTAIFPDSITADQAKYISNKDYEIALKTIFLYKDTFGSQYTSTICQSRLPNGNLTIGPCTGYPFVYFMNDTDKCKNTYK